MSVTEQYFDEIFRDNNDPWAFRQRWYERRKRALTLAALPRERYTAIFEPGCANGELSAGLAGRCDHLLCCDTSALAVDLARERLAPFQHARVLHARLPQQWPEGQFDLIVFSELGYYLDLEDLQRWIDCALASLKSGGQLLACHWRPDIEDCPLNAERVHEVLDERLKMHRLFSHHEDDFLLDLWSHDPVSVATRENLR
ncbi:class I SAM-dependent methyltransferase [Pseudomonas cichorii]|uniref:Class I SAM-dependent methyltransferase n=1 Tax=Pseudomonas lijiangensis TaxID=2995658 RepID=A0ABX8HX60_9PSED|nr:MULTISPECIES: class I SAM-dependent methyltransferase [Pseudomonas syringae group]MBX8501888.1 class I SAM-dependent methyltransferase [Pseudomonas lijiangensis]MBX8506723.1 class I SAM-dependent methyltransferase [Pseudomonas lijiangensis]MBX8518481.1 class I SAM-dependent methyltransferase [Pseudomonas cichorii]MBX8541826.1 class I SAM-dependent methyltransferase [Pseudomonas cichorii]MBX8546226.1 class I SAM-dependent methyltransferase [Pseudomonas cichorii]